MKTNEIQFAPHLAIKVLRPAVEFYVKALGAQTVRTFDNEDGSIHVAEMLFQGLIFHLHEETPRNHQLSPESVSSTSVLIGVFVPDPDKLYKMAITAGAAIVSPMQDYDYGYRQATIADPFGHQWLIQKKI
ncbi:MAG: VOC family protein [Chryseolinea sp.]